MNEGLGEEDDCKLPALEVSPCGACWLHGVRAPVSVTVRAQAVVCNYFLFIAVPSLECWSLHSAASTDHSSAASHRQYSQSLGLSHI